MYFCQFMCLEYFNTPENYVNDVHRKQYLGSSQYNLRYNYILHIWITHNYFYLCFGLFKSVVKQR